MVYGACYSVLGTKKPAPSFATTRNVRFCLPGSGAVGLRLPFRAFGVQGFTPCSPAPTAADLEPGRGAEPGRAGGRSRAGPGGGAGSGRRRLGDSGPPRERTRRLSPGRAGTRDRDTGVMSGLVVPAQARMPRTDAGDRVAQDPGGTASSWPGKTKEP